MTRAYPKIIWWIFAGLCVSVGLYPVIYFLIDGHFGLLATKSPELLRDSLWNTGFYGHIIFGGVALLIGWTQFSTSLRARRIALHRNLGKVYGFAVLVSGISGIYIGAFATGGVISSIGFVSLGIVWVSTTGLAFNAIRHKRLAAHKDLMTLSYAACFAAVTLRIWLPILTSITGEFISAYRIVAWLCWVPNVLVAYFLINRKGRGLTRHAG